MSRQVARRIRRLGLSIYDSLAEHPELFLSDLALQRVLSKALVGFDLDYPLRTRSKVLKTRVCEAIGYPVPPSFRRTKPRFPGQNFDAFVQKANNLQIWNDEVSAARRYVVIRVDNRDRVTKVRVIRGEELARFDPTGTLTHKFQAKARSPVTRSVLVSAEDTPNVRAGLLAGTRSGGEFFPIDKLFSRLKTLVGAEIANPGKTQERNRGGALHAAVCRALGNRSYRDSGQFPDVVEQLLEVKLQTASTIDLGLICPDSMEMIADHPEFHHSDVRYAVFYGTLVRGAVRLDHLVLTTGRDFFSVFKRFEGNIRNSKLQIHLPADFFD